MNRIRNYFVKALICLLMLYGCNSEKKEPLLFTIVEHQQTGLDFSNQLVPTSDINAIEYMYFYNGGGVAVGDVNGDGLPDIFFTSDETLKNSVFWLCFIFLCCVRFLRMTFRKSCRKTASTILPPFPATFASAIIPIG